MGYLMKGRQALVVSHGFWRKGLFLFHKCPTIIAYIGRQELLIFNVESGP